jgi:hypothetical protein
MKDLKKYDSASYYIHKGIQFNKKFNNTRWLATDYLRLGELMSSLKQYDSAEYYLDKSSAEFSKLNHIGSTIYVINQKGQIARDRKSMRLRNSFILKPISCQSNTRCLSRNWMPSRGFMNCG